jgi:hypothetical protein
MSSLVPLRKLPQTAGFRKGDVLVVFGELFSRGYANGIVDEAERAGMTIVRSTVGRRDETGKLRPLNEEELATQPKPFINIPLEAGFDLEPCSQDGMSPAAQIAGIKLSDWENAKLDWAKVEDSRRKGTERFKANAAAYMRELGKYIPKGANVIFAHTMAGGVPRAKILMPVMNRVFKGVGDRHLPSEQFWKSQLGKLTAMSFEDVSASTLQHLLDASRELKTRIEGEGGTVRYVAYGYHGTEVMIRGEYVWQSYAPYLQGWAKMKLENIAQDAWTKGTQVTVYNCPEILTNSSSIFVGVEVPLYPFLAALEHEGKNLASIQKTLDECKSLLKPEHDFKEIVAFTDKALTSEEIRKQCVYEKWPQHNAKQQMETLINASETLIEMHKDQKQLITFVLSEEIFKATGYVMFHDAWKQQAPVLWLGHDVLAKALVETAKQ